MCLCNYQTMRLFSCLLSKWFSYGVSPLHNFADLKDRICKALIRILIMPTCLYEFGTNKTIIKMLFMWLREVTNKTFYCSKMKSYETCIIQLIKYSLVFSIFYSTRVFRILFIDCKAATQTITLLSSWIKI